MTSSTLQVLSLSVLVLTGEIGAQPQCPGTSCTTTSAFECPITNGLVGNSGFGTSLFDYAPKCAAYAGTVPLSFDNHKQVLTIFRPDLTGAQKAPVILYTNAGVFLEPYSCPSNTSLRGPNRILASDIGGELYSLLQIGWAIVTIGTTGVDSYSNANLFFPQGTPEWDDATIVYGEKEFAWARQFIALHADELQLDNNTVVAWGRSSGAIYAAFTALGPDRTSTDPFLCEDGVVNPQLNLSTHCVGLIAENLPVWLPAWKTSLSGIHWPDAQVPTISAATLGNTLYSYLVADSPSSFIQDCNSNAYGTPCLFLYDEPLIEDGSTLDFSRDALPPCTMGDTLPGTPSLSDDQPLTVVLHPSWSGIIIKQDAKGIPQDAGFHDVRTSLLFSADIDTSGLLTQAEEDLIDARFTGNLVGGLWQPLALNWVNQFLGLSIASLSKTTDSNNFDLLSSTDTPFLGTNWDCTVSDLGFPGSSGIVFVSCGTSNIPTSYGQILVSLPELLSMSSPLSGGVAAFSFALPGDPSLSGLSLYAQAVMTATDRLRYSHRLNLVLGYTSS